MKKLYSLIFVMLFVFSAAFVFAAKEKEVPKVEKTMPFSKGICLGNWLCDYGNGNVNSSYFRRQDFEDMKTLGVEIVRVNITFEEFSSGEPDYIVEDWLWEKIDDSVEWCTELKMYMIITFMNGTGSGSKTKPDVEKMLLKIWPQITARYKDSSEYILYEIYNEPHFLSGNLAGDVSKWNKIQGNVLKKIRETDKTRTVIVGAENWNGIEEVLKLPDYKDDNIILNFHDYNPFLFTHQAVTWTGVGRFKHVPFPYVKEKMPPIPENPTDSEKWCYESYPEMSKETTLVKPLDNAVKFANKRGLALMCNEFGANVAIDNTERVNWIKSKVNWMDERNIIRLNHEYKGYWAIFNNTKLNPLEARFPEDLNIEVIKALGFNVPQEKSRKHYSWFENAKKTNDYTIYRNGFAKGVYASDGWADCRINKKDAGEEDTYIYLPKADAWATIKLLFGENYDFSDLVNSGKSLEFEVRTTQKDLKLCAFFAAQEIEGIGKEGLPWDCEYVVSGKSIPADGKWHKVSIPLKNFRDNGAWSDIEQKSYPPEGKFSWKKIYCLKFAMGENGLKDNLSIRNIAIR